MLGLWDSDHIQVSPDLHGFDLRDFRINIVSWEVFKFNFLDETKYSGNICQTIRTRLKLTEVCIF
jgi:hypothetical protein